MCKKQTWHVLSGKIDILKHKICIEYTYKFHQYNLVISSGKLCQVFDSYVHSSNYALLTIAEMPNNELTSIHTLSLPSLHL